MLWGDKLLQSCPTLCKSVQPYGLSPIGLLCPWDFPDKNTGAGCTYICKTHVSGFFSASEEYVCIYHILFIRSSIDEHWGGSTFWLKSAAVSIDVQMSV